MSGPDQTFGARWSRELDEAAGAIEAIRGSLAVVELIADSLVDVLRNGGSILACGNGGSALAAQHFAAELMGHFQHERRPLRGLALAPDAGLITAIANDYSYDKVFSRQVDGLGTPNDALLALSTSGGSANVLAAVRRAREIGMLTVGFCGGDGGELARLTEHAVIIPIADTARVQEGHLVLIHLISQRLDEVFASEAGSR